MTTDCDIKHTINNFHKICKVQFCNNILKNVPLTQLNYINFEQICRGV